jgi:phage baseplate assembly protein W
MKISDACVRTFGQNLTDLLDTDEKRRTALALHEMLVETIGDYEAREWLMTSNESLGGMDPFRALADDRRNEVVLAAKARSIS